VGISLSTILLSILDMVCLTIAVRAFLVYHKTHNDTLFILGLSMVTIAFSGLFGVATQLGFIGTNTDTNSSWSKYIGPSSGFLFIFLSSIAGSNERMRILKGWQIIFVVLYFLLALLSPILPRVPDRTTEVMLNGVRCLACVLPFLRYMLIYIKKETHFSLFMCLAFMLMGIGYVVSTPQLLQPNLLVFSTVGSSIRIIGYGTLLAAFTTK